MKKRIVLMGAGGKMGCRITDNLKDIDRYEVRYVEVSEPGIRKLAERGLAPVPLDAALPGADVVILAVPDKLIPSISRELVPRLDAGTLMITLDPAAAYARAIPIREDLSYCVTHPCHPPLFGGTECAGEPDWFGGVRQSQHVVCALLHGSEADYTAARAIAADMFGNEACPVLGVHRVTVEQMAMLEPALVETFAATLIYAIKELGDEVVARGVPRPAMEAFLRGHLRTILAIVFGHAGFPFSDGALLAIAKAKRRIFLRDWKENVMKPENIRRTVEEIIGKVTVEV